VDNRERNNLEADLSAYLDGELDAGRAREVSEYLATSPQARALLEDLRRIAGELGELPRQSAPANLAAVLRDAAARQVGAHRPGRAASRWWLVAAQVTGSAALLAACVYVGWLVYAPRSATPSPRSNVVTEGGAQVALGKDATLGFEAHEAPADADQRLRSLGYADQSQHYGVLHEGNQPGGTVDDKLAATAGSRLGYVQGMPAAPAADRYAAWVRVEINPADEAEFAQALRLLQEAGATAVATPELDGDGIGDARGREYAQATRRGGRVSSELPATRATYDVVLETDRAEQVADALVRAVPGRVYVGAQFYNWELPATQLGQPGQPAVNAARGSDEETLGRDQLAARERGAAGRSAGRGFAGGGRGVASAPADEVREKKEAGEENAAPSAVARPAPSGGIAARARGRSARAGLRPPPETQRVDEAAETERSAATEGAGETLRAGIVAKQLQPPTAAGSQPTEGVVEELGKLLPPTSAAAVADINTLTEAPRRGFPLWDVAGYFSALQLAGGGQRVHLHIVLHAPPAPDALAEPTATQPAGD